MLQPVTLSPSAVSSAAPTSKCEIARVGEARAPGSPRRSGRRPDRRCSRPRLRAAAPPRRTRRGDRRPIAALAGTRRSLESAGRRRVLTASGAGRGALRLRAARPRGQVGFSGRSEALNDPLQQGRELAADPRRHRHHFIVIERLRQDARRGVGDARDAEHFERPCGAPRWPPARWTCRPRRRRSCAGSGSRPGVS